MPDPPARPVRWKRRIRRILAVLLIAPPALLALGNIALATPWARSALAGKIEARTGLEARVGSASWTPWGGAFIGDLHLLQPQVLRDAVPHPVLEIRGIRILPRWKDLLDGNLKIAEIRVDHPRGAIALEMLASLASHGLVREPAVIAGTPPKDSAPETIAVPEAPASPPDKSKPRAGRTPLPAAPKPLPAPPSGARDTLWIEVAGGDLDFYWSGVNVVRMTGCSARIPVGGDAAEGTCSAKSLIAFGRSFAADLALPLSWKAPELHIGPGMIGLAGMQVRAEAGIGRVPGFPFAADFQVAEQALDAAPLFQTIRPAAGKFSARAQAQGLLRLPSTWQAVAAGEAETVAMTLGSQALAFDDARAALTLQGGVLNCSDARMTGEAVSFLGNGMLRMNGEGNAVLRAVVPPEVVQAWRQRFSPAGPDAMPVFTEMETPERVFIDLRWVPYPGGTGIELGSGGPVLPLGEAAKLFSAPGAG